MIEQEVVTNNEQSSFKERLLKFLKHKNLNNKQFEDMVGLSRSYISNMRKGIKSETFDQKIAPLFPELNKIWLFYGDGEMILSETERFSENEKKVPFTELRIDDKLNLIFKFISDQNEKIDSLIQENHDIKGKLNDNLYVIQSELKAIMIKFDVQLDSKLEKNIKNIFDKNQLEHI
jgi:transcriptional regulator with XRE-family HTH domain